MKVSLEVTNVEAEKSTPESGAFLFLNTSCRKKQETDKNKTKKTKKEQMIWKELAKDMNLLQREAAFFKVLGDL